jgi:Uma2 family endonuclease
MTTQRKATFDELYAAVRALPEGITGEILTDGRIETMGRPGRGHTRFSGRLLRSLYDLEDSPSAGWVFDAGREVRVMADRLAAPDLAGWRYPAENASFLDENPIRLVPDWACEVLSDATASRDRKDKLPLYLRAGVRHVWLADPDARTVEVFAGSDRQPQRVALARGNELAMLPPFEGYALDLRALWLPQRR